MKKLPHILTLSIILIFSIIFALTSCHNYTPSDDYTFNNGISIIRIDSANYSVTSNSKIYYTKKFDTNIKTYLIDGTELSNTDDLDTCIQVVCTSISYCTPSEGGGICWFYKFITLDGKNYIKLMSSNWGSHEQQEFSQWEKINLFINKTMLGKTEKID